MRKREGIEPRHGYTTVDADVVMFTEGHIKGAQQAMAPANPPGSKTVARHQGSVGTKAASGTREILWALPRTGVGWHNRHAGRKPDTPEEVGCLHMSDEVG